MPSLRGCCHAKPVGGPLGIDRHLVIAHEGPPQRTQHHHLDGDDDEQMADESAIVGAHRGGGSRGLASAIGGGFLPVAQKVT